MPVRRIDTPERWERVKDLYDAVRVLPQRERAGFLASSSGGDEELRRDVQRHFTCR